MPTPTFLFTTCRQGSEAKMKREISARYQGLLTPAYMRPQLITWKIQGALPPDFYLESMYALTSGVSLGMAKMVEDIPALIAAAVVVPAVLHVFPREAPEEGVPEETWARVDAVAGETARILNLSETNTPRPGDLVLNVIVGEEGEPMLIGLHQHTATDFKRPGGLLRATLPPEAPSRAWLKMEQALDWLEIGHRLQGRTVLELGSAPGGASHSLLARGATVYGVDTGEMDARVLAHPQFHHLRVAAGDLKPRMLPPEVDLLVSDMNLEPRVVCQYVEKFALRLNPRKMVLTLKINSAEVEADLPALIDRVRHWAPGRVDVRQFPANRQEVTLVAWGEA